MEDIVLVSGVLYLRPPAGREDEKVAGNAIFGVRPPEGGDEGIICDGVIEFRPPARGVVGKNSQSEFFGSPAAKTTGVPPYKKESGIILSTDEEENAAEDEGSME